MHVNSKFDINNNRFFCCNNAVFYKRLHYVTNLGSNILTKRRVDWFTRSSMLGGREESVDKITEKSALSWRNKYTEKCAPG